MTIQKARQLRNNPTEAERALWQNLRFRQMNGYKFRRQHPIGPYIVDLVCIEKRLIIELDGGHHSEPDETQYDQARTDWLRSRGFQVLRFWNNQVLAEVESVKTVILTELEAQDPSQQSSEVPSPLIDGRACRGRANGFDGAPPGSDRYNRYREASTTDPKIHVIPEP